MSVEAITWALSQPVKQSSAKFVLVVMANRADGDMVCWPSTADLCQQTSQDRKTVQENIRRLRDWGFIEDTGERKGSTKQVIVYRLKTPEIGPVDRDQPQSCAKHYVYRLTESTTGNYYIGVRSCYCHPEEDRSYKGSGRWPTYCTLHKIKLSKEIIGVFESRDEAEAVEREMIALLRAE